MALDTGVSHCAHCSFGAKDQRRDTALASSSISCSSRHPASSLISLDLYQGFPAPIMPPLPLSASSYARDACCLHLSVQGSAIIAAVINTPMQFLLLCLWKDLPHLDNMEQPAWHRLCLWSRAASSPQLWPDWTGYVSTKPWCCHLKKPPPWLQSEFDSISTWSDPLNK